MGAASPPRQDVRVRAHSHTHTNTHTYTRRIKASGFLEQACTPLHSKTKNSYTLRLAGQQTHNKHIPTQMCAKK